LLRKNAFAAAPFGHLSPLDEFALQILGCVFDLFGSQ
jgi:hypothetical protein